MQTVDGVQQDPARRLCPPGLSAVSPSSRPLELASVRVCVSAGMRKRASVRERERADRIKYKNSQVKILKLIFMPVGLYTGADGRRAWYELPRCHSPVCSVPKAKTLGLGRPKRFLQGSIHCMTAVGTAQRGKPTC
jgi:hypothetical protein